MTKRSMFKSLGLALGCATLVLTTAAIAPPRTVPVNGTFGTSFQLVPTATQGVFHNTIQGVGNVQGLGICTIAVEETVDLRTDPGTGEQTWVMTFANGDQLTATLHGTGTFDQTNPAFIRLAFEGTVTGGTGRFQDGTGKLRGPGVAYVDTAPGVFPAEGHGTLALQGLVRLRKN